MTRVRPQVARRMYDGACLLCGERDHSCLQAHRVVPGCRYVYESLVTLCASCHNKWHGGRIVFHGKHPSTRGTVVQITVDGVRLFVPDSRRGREDMEDVWE